MLFGGVESINDALSGILALIYTADDLTFLVDYLLVPLVDTIKSQEHSKTTELALVAIEQLLLNITKRTLTSDSLLTF